VKSRSLLKTQEVSKNFGGLEALKDITLWLEEGEILGLIGPNGAGKTTLFNVISGFLRPTRGRVTFQDREIQGLPPHRIASLGIGRTFQIVKPFAELSVLDNVLTGYGHRFYASLQALFDYYRNKSSLEAARRIIDQVELTAQAETKASNLPIGLQRRLEIARALALEPTLLLLDEPAAGLTHAEAQQLDGLIRNLRENGITIIVIEHNMAFAMQLCDRIVVLAQGQEIAQGQPQEVRENLAVIEAYLGHSDHA
jgi:branched-chain amino acid transport system ATP-binding protein